MDAARLERLEQDLAAARAAIDLLRREVELKDRRIAALEAELAGAKDELREVLKENTLQQADLSRAEAELQKLLPNCPERVAQEDLQFGLDRVLCPGEPRETPSIGEESPASAGALKSEDAPAAREPKAPPIPAPSADEVRAARDVLQRRALAAGQTRRRRRALRKGGLGLREADLPLVEVPVIPADVEAQGVENFELVGEEVFSRIVRLPARLVRTAFRLFKYKAKAERSSPSPATEGAPGTTPTAPPEDKAEAEAAPLRDAQGLVASVSASPDLRVAPPPQAATLVGARGEGTAGPILQSGLPEDLWPRFSVDVSVIAHIIISKYDDALPLHRQEKISRREGVPVPRALQDAWLGRAAQVLRYIVDAMFADGKATAPIVATDSTRAPIRNKHQREDWSYYVFLFGMDHVVFRATPDGGHAGIAGLLEGFSGKLIGDAAPIYDALFATGRRHRMVEVACWAHFRRYVWKALVTERDLALQGVALIAQLYALERGLVDAGASLDEVRDRRQRESSQVLILIDDWAHRALRSKPDPRGRLASALTYYRNQRDALRRFIEDPRLPLDNTASERQLRAPITGRHNWFAYRYPSGVLRDGIFRSLIASARLHALNPEVYLDEMLRLGPSWPVPRILELAPNKWRTTRAALTPAQRDIVAPPWRTQLFGEPRGIDLPATFA